MLIYAEQGFGDTLQFVRYVPLLQDCGAHLIVQVQPPLVALIARQFPTVTTLSTLEKVESFDFHVPLMSLPLALFKREKNIPRCVPYLRPDAIRVASIRRKIDTLLGADLTLKVGLVWSGSRKFHNDVRVARLADLAPILELPFCFVSLQKEVPEADLPLLTSLPNVHDFRDSIGDFSDTADLLAALDLVITIDTATAHLAGAMGLNVWTLLAYQADWRWHADQTKSSWYPTMSLFRQSVAGDWDAVARSIAARLVHLGSQAAQDRSRLERSLR